MGQLGKYLDVFQQDRMAVLAAEAGLVLPQVLSAAQGGAGPPGPGSFSPLPQPENPQAMDRDRNRIIRTHSWI